MCVFSTCNSLAMHGINLWNIIVFFAGKIVFLSHEKKASVGVSYG
jgi:hypothetical protein